MSKKEKVVFAEIWRGGQLVIEERWEDAPGGKQTTRYAFPGGKVEVGETLEQAMSRELAEETGIEVKPEDWTEPEEFRHETIVGFGFRQLVSAVVEVKDGVVLWDMDDLIDHKKRGKLMPLTDEYVERNF